MRIIAGERRGLRLVAPPGTATRPTSDRLRGTIFDILTHRLGGFDGLRVLDLFAGSGAMGLEALSRGAAFAAFVETAGDARAVIRRNLDAAAMLGRSRVWRRDATRLGPPPTAPFDLAFLDPPYARGLGEATLAALAAHPWMRDEALAVLEESGEADIGDVAGWTLLERRSAGASAIAFYQRACEE